MIFILIALAIAPAIGIILLVYFKDKFEHEPFSLLLKCFLLGILTIIPAIIIELLAGKLDPSQTNNPGSIFIYAFFIVGLSEEGSKFFLLRIYPYRSKHFNEPFDGIVYSVVISMGFAAAENIFYVLDGGMSVALLRMFTAVPGHAAFGVLMGFYVGMAKFKKNHFGYLLFGLFVAMAAHGFYDWFLFQQDLPGLQILSFVCLSLIVIFSFRAMKIQKKNSPFNPLNQPPISPLSGGGQHEN
jgi:RsiW-degrading membrane proteinase PrsW (M82 family)